MDEFARLGYTLDGDSVSSISGIACVEVEAGLLVGADCDAWVPVDGLAQVGAFTNAVVAFQQFLKLQKDESFSMETEFLNTEYGLLRQHQIHDVEIQLMLDAIAN